MQSNHIRPPAGGRAALHTVPTEAKQRIEISNRFDAGLTDDQQRILDLIEHPGDTWGHVKVSIHVDEEAEDPYYG